MKIYLKKLINRLRLNRVEKLLAHFDLIVAERDYDANSLLIPINDDTCIFFTLNTGGRGPWFETTISLATDMLNVQCLSAITNIAYSHYCTISGVRRSTADTVRLDLCAEFSGRPTRKKLAYAVGRLGSCMHAINAVIADIEKCLNLTNLDLSMFNDVELFMFNPQRLGEQKALVHGSWKAYEKYILARNEHNPNAARADETIDDLQACEAFELANNLLLAEVGDVVLQEIIWNKKMSDSANEDETMLN